MSDSSTIETWEDDCSECGKTFSLCDESRTFMHEGFCSLVCEGDWEMRSENRSLQEIASHMTGFMLDVMKLPLSDVEKFMSLFGDFVVHAERREHARRKSAGRYI